MFIFNLESLRINSICVFLSSEGHYNLPRALMCIISCSASVER